MQLIISGKNVHVPHSLKAYTEKKIGKLDHFLPSLMEGHVVFATEKTKNAAQTHLVRVTLHSDGNILRGEQRSSGFSAAVDAVTEKLYKEIDRWKGKHSHGRIKSERVGLTMEETRASTSAGIVRRKRFPTPAMSEKQAIKAMNALGHEFYLFKNRATGALNVIYRRHDGNYGLIEPEAQE